MKKLVLLTMVAIGLAIAPAASIAGSCCPGDKKEEGATKEGEKKEEAKKEEAKKDEGTKEGDKK